MKLHASDRLGQKILSKTVHFRPNTDGEQFMRKFDDLAKKIKPQSEEEHEFYN